MAKRTSVLLRTLSAAAIATALTLGLHGHAAAHCDTLDGPVVQDARKALEIKDVTPVLKWIRAKDETLVKDSFSKAVAARGKQQQEGAEMKFFQTLVRIHRAGEGASFTGLKPAGQVEPVVAEADRALADGSPDVLVKLATDAVNRGIRQRYEKVAEARRHKDESVHKGREFVAAYVEYTHYVERLHTDAVSAAAHHGDSNKEHDVPKHEHGHHQ